MCHRIFKIIFKEILRMFKESGKCASRNFLKNVDGCFKNDSRKSCLAIFFLHGTHRSYMSQSWKKVGSTGSILPEHPGTHETRPHPKGVFIMAIYPFKLFFLLKLLHFWFSHWNTCSIVLQHIIFQNQWDWIVLPLTEKYLVAT